MRSTEPLRQKIEAIEARSRPKALAVAMRDLGTGLTFDHHADRWFHAASTIKVGILLGVYGAIHEGRLVAQSRVHVRNRFSSAWDGSPFRVASERDANSEVHQHIGSTMRVSELALHMIATSSNLATNLLLDLVGLDTVQRCLESLHIHGVDVRRGVEDERAFEHHVNNRVTADGLAALLRAIAEERAFSPEISRQMVDVLHAQEFKSGIPARLPKAVRVAHKTGEISTVAHDAGIVYPPDCPPYVLVVLTEWEPDGTGRSATIAEVSRAIYEFLHADGGAARA
ncbi:serine hydrolase [Gemmatirosa kalamazoonensis]|uniref:serine hydrolase n=1 Tax=Gemmatirosa kalamazoonensis TaxID=861299 RepID=UPI0004B6B941|nr:serine hydrolase [Gemmatirosa kalamazoonensis]